LPHIQLFRFFNFALLIIYIEQTFVISQVAREGWHVIRCHLA